MKKSMSELVVQASSLGQKHVEQFWSYDVTKMIFFDIFGDLFPVLERTYLKNNSHTKYQLFVALNSWDIGFWSSTLLFSAVPWS